MPCGWEGNRRSGVALAMRHGLRWFIHLLAHGLDREMTEHRAYALLWSMAHLPFTLHLAYFETPTNYTNELPVVKVYVDRCIGSKDVTVGEVRQHTVTDRRRGAGDADIQSRRLSLLQ